MKREDGFYRTKIDGKWTISFFCDAGGNNTMPEWSPIGYDRAFHTAELHGIKGPITMPTDNTTTNRQISPEHAQLKTLAAKGGRGSTRRMHKLQELTTRYLTEHKWRDRT